MKRKKVFYSQNSRTTHDDKRVISLYSMVRGRTAIFTCTFHCSLYLDAFHVSCARNYFTNDSCCDNNET